MNKLFEGHTINYIECINVDYKSTRREPFMDVQVRCAMLLRTVVACSHVCRMRCAGIAMAHGGDCGDSFDASQGCAEWFTRIACHRSCVPAAGRQELQGHLRLV